MRAHHALRLLAVLLLTLAIGCDSGPRPAEPDCSNPQSATDSLLVWQSSSHHDMTRATACVEPVPGKDIKRLAAQLKQVLDARGLYVPVETLPDDPSWTDEDGNAKVQPLETVLPELIVRRGKDGSWRYAKDTLRAAPRLYAETFSASAAWLRDQLPDAFFVPLGPVAAWQLLFGVLLVALSWMTGRVVRWFLRNRAYSVVERLGAHIDHDVYERTNQPLMWLASLFVLSWGIPQLQLPIELSRDLVFLTDLTFRFAAIVTALRFLDVIVDVATGVADTTDSKLDDQLIPLIRQAARTLVLALGLLVVLEAVGVDVWKLLAGVSIGSLVFALAAQDTVANMFGSINVFLDRPFQIGDWVVIGDVEGVVEEVGFRSTRIRTFYNSQVTVPNSKLTNANIDNYGRRHQRRVKLTLGLTYDTPPDKLQAYVEGVRAILMESEGVVKPFEVHVYNLGASAIEILAYYHLRVPGWHDELATRAQNILQFIQLAHDLDVSFAFPSTSVYLESTPDKPLSPQETAAMEQLQALVDSYGPGGAKTTPKLPQTWDPNERA